ncbi:MAG: peptidylprolyl isomerase [Actinomycetota bacterium]|nr:peptidylprolyl isomerase [Actinomycetota bacterium]
MTNQEKRARQKERRAAIVAAQQAAARRQRIIRGALGFLALAAIIGLAIFAGGNAPGGDEGSGETEDVACGAEAPPAADPQQYPEPPEMALEDGVDYRATITTSCGVIEMDLLEEEAPITVNNFVFLANEGFYEGLTFHRVEPNKVIQGGAPEPSGAGGPGYEIQDELPKSGDEYVFGTVAMANRGPDTAGSQFFVNMRDPDPEGGFKPSGYPPDYALFGKVDPADQESVDTLLEIADQETTGEIDPATGAPSTRPAETVYIESVEITEA